MPSIDIAFIRVMANRYFTGGSSGKVFKGMATLAMGNGLAKIIGLLSVQVLTRIYGPEHFGILSVFTALLLILTPLMTLRYELAVPLPNRDGTAMALMAASCFFLVAMTLVLGLLLWFVGPAILSLISMEVLTPYRGLLIVALFFTGLYEVLLIWAVRRRAYSAVVRTQLRQSIVGAIGKIALGLAGLLQVGLLVGQVAGAAAGMLGLVRTFGPDIKRYKRHITAKRTWRLLQFYKSFPAYRLPAQLLQIFSSQSPLLLTAALFDAQTTGQLGLALMTLAIPMQLLGYTTSKAYYAEIASLGRKRAAEVRAVTYSVVKRLFAFSLIPSAMLLFFGEDLFEIAFGAQWSKAGELAAILAIYLLFQFIHAPASHLLSVFQRQRLLLMLNVQRTALTIACFTIAHLMDLSIASVIQLYSITLSAHYLFSLLMSLRVIPRCPEA